VPGPDVQHEGISLRIASASAVFAISSTPYRPIDESALRSPLSKERRGTFFAEVRPSSDGGALTMGGLVNDVPGVVLMHGACSSDPASSRYLKDGLGDQPSGEFALVGDWGDERVAARDPLGAKPLYQGRGEGLAAVATEPSVLRNLGLAPEPVPPGHAVTLKGGALRAKAYCRPLSGGEFKGSLDEAAERVGKLLSSSMELRLKRAKAVGVAFSGGLDSSLLAFSISKVRPVVLVSVCVEGSKDASYVSKAADELGLELHMVKTTKEEVATSLQAVGDLPVLGSPMDRALWAGFNIASRNAAKLGLDTLVAGQGADEIFGGYHRHLKAGTSINSMLLKELPKLESGLRRDEAAVSRGGCEASFPYADFPLARFALNLPSSSLVSGGERKVVLKKLGESMGLPDSIVNAEKKAFQYSSGLQDLV
jgi:asparagine synthase (glutamine-hydrolysing)